MQNKTIDAITPLILLSVQEFNFFSTQELLVIILVTVGLEFK